LSYLSAYRDSFYGWEKLYIEKMLEAFSKDYGLDVRITRFHNIYSPESTFVSGREKSRAALCRKVAESYKRFFNIAGRNLNKRTK